MHSSEENFDFLATTSLYNQNKWNYNTKYEISAYFSFVENDAHFLSEKLPFFFFFCYRGGATFCSREKKWEKVESTAFSSFI